MFRKKSCGTCAEAVSLNYVGPVDDAGVEHELYGLFPVPARSAVWQEACIADRVLDADLLVHKVVVTKNALIHRLNLVQWGKDWQWFCVLIQSVAPAPNNVDFDSGILPGV